MSHRPHAYDGGLVTLTIRTRHPENYVLCNIGDGTTWRPDPTGSWSRVAPAPERVLTGAHHDPNRPTHVCDVEHLVPPEER